MVVNKYNIYIICKSEDIFQAKADVLKQNYSSKICHIQWIPAEYLTLTQCNQPMVKKLNTIYNTKKKSIIAKLGCIAAHRKALLAVFSNQTFNNLILEEDASVEFPLPSPPKQSCYMGGWIVPPKISQTGKVKLTIKPKRNKLNEIKYDTFQVITTHALFLKTHQEAVDLLHQTIQPETMKNYDIFLANKQIFKYYYYPSIFVQEKHTSEITHNVNKNYIYTYNYGLTSPKQTKKKSSRKSSKTKRKYSNKRNDSKKGK